MIIVVAKLKQFRSMSNGDSDLYGLLFIKEQSKVEVVKYKVVMELLSRFLQSLNPDRLLKP